MISHYVLIVNSSLYQHELSGSTLGDDFLDEQSHRSPGHARFDENTVYSSFLKVLLIYLPLKAI